LDKPPIAEKSHSSTILQHPYFSSICTPSDTHVNFMQNVHVVDNVNMLHLSCQRHKQFNAPPLAGRLLFAVSMSLPAP
jgi:hypothetical protein